MAKAKTFQKLLEEVTPELVTAKIAEVNKAFDERAAYEAKERAGNDSIQAHLKSYQKKMATPAIAGVLVAANVDPNFINRSITSGRRFNVYAVDKVNDLLGALAAGTTRNAINQAIMRSLFRFRAAGVQFTGAAAIAAATDKEKVDKAWNALLVRHTASVATAPTQTSSTMNALQVLGVVQNKGSQKHPIWELTDSPVTKRLEEIYEPKPATVAA